jgi:hypothetical protein
MLYNSILTDDNRTPPACPTIFEQINGTSSKINGQHILANRQSTPVNPIPNLMDDGPSPGNVTFTSLHNQHGLANCEGNCLDRIPNLLDDDVVPASETTNHLDNLLTQPNDPSRRAKERHVEVYTNDKISHVKGNAVLADGNTGLIGNHTNTDGSVAPKKGETPLAKDAAINGNTSMVNGSAGPQSSICSSSETEESLRW